MKRLIDILAVILGLAAATACGRSGVEEKECIYSCGDFEVYADSIVRGGKIYRALSDRKICGAWHMADSAATTPRYISQQRMADALFTKALSERMPMPTSEEVWLSLGLLRPEESEAALRAIADTPVPDNLYFPFAATDPYWAAAAWEVYCANGSKKWLKEAYETIEASLRRHWRTHRSSEPPLVCGTPRYVLQPAAYYPEWMDEMDRFQSIAASVNICHSHTYKILSLMAAELRLYAEKEHESSARRLRDAVNDRFWLPEQQRYAQYLYCDYYPVPSINSDNRANALAVLFDIATPEMSAAIVASSPLLEGSVPTVYPSTTKKLAPEASVATLFGLAAARVRNAAAFNMAVGTLWNSALGSQLPAQWPALVLRGLFGISLTTAGMTFAPMVPPDFDGDKRIEGLRYRGATLDISLHGTGDRIAAFMLDSVSSSEPRIPADLEGNHKIDITLSGNDLHEAKINLCQPMQTPPTPKVQWTGAREARVANFDRSLRYGVFVDGVLVEELHGDRYHISDSGVTVTGIVPSEDRVWAGYTPRPHVSAPEGTLITINASSVTPRRPPLHLIKDRNTATNYIELAARHNTRITCYANVAEAGEYFITVGYSNGSTRCAMRALGVNDRDVATLIFPSRRPNDWVRVYPSTTVAVSLKEGVNKLSLTYIGGTILLNKITLLKKE